jgi:hypothetical protein
MGIEPVGSQSSGADHYQLISQTGPFFLWGFDGNPSTMTTKGQRAFVNILEYLSP